MKQINEFNKFATKHRGINSLTLNKYQRSIRADYISPNIIEERQLNVAVMSVFDRLLMDRIIFLGAGIDDTVANIIQAQLLYLASVDSTRDISIYCASPGGNVDSGLGIISVMEYIKPDVATLCTSMAASMAAVILCAGAKGKRSALKYSRIMIHQISSGVEGQLEDIEININEAKKLKKELYTILSDRTGHTYNKIEKDCSRDYWMSSEEAKKYGIIDEIVTTQK